MEGRNFLVQKLLDLRSSKSIGTGQKGVSEESKYIPEDGVEYQVPMLENPSICTKLHLVSLVLLFKKIDLTVF